MSFGENIPDDFSNDPALEKTSWIISPAGEIILDEISTGGG